MDSPLTAFNFDVRHIFAQAWRSTARYGGAGLCERFYGSKPQWCAPEVTTPDAPSDACTRTVHTDAELLQIEPRRTVGGKLLHGVSYYEFPCAAC